MTEKKKLCVCVCVTHTHRERERERDIKPKNGCNSKHFNNGKLNYFGGKFEQLLKRKKYKLK